MSEEELKGYTALISSAKDMNDAFEKITKVINQIQNNGKNPKKEAQRIIDGLNSELNVAIELGQLEDIIHLDSLLDLFQELLEEKEETNEIVEETEKKVIFSKSKANNILIDRDIKRIKPSKEVSEEIQKVFDFIQSGRTPNSPVYSRPLSNNKKKQGVIEYKTYQVRVYVRTLKDNFVCVIGLKIKDGMRPKHINEFVARRNKEFNNSGELEELQKLIDNGGGEILVSEGKEKIAQIIEQAKGKDKASIESNTEDFNEEDIYSQWQVICARIANYVYEHEGTINVPEDYMQGEFPFGKWIAQQRNEYENKMLDEEQISALEAMNIAWNYEELKENNQEQTPEKTLSRNEKIWLKQYEMVKKVKEVYGSIAIPNGIRFNGKDLAGWIYKQIHKYKNHKLPEKCIASLNELDEEWTAGLSFLNETKPLKEIFDSEGAKLVSQKLGMQVVFDKKTQTERPSQGNIKPPTASLELSTEKIIKKDNTQVPLSEEPFEELEPFIEEETEIPETTVTEEDLNTRIANLSKENERLVAEIAYKENQIKQIEELIAQNEELRRQSAILDAKIEELTRKVAEHEEGKSI